MRSIVIAAPQNYLKYILELGTICEKVIWLGPEVNKLDMNNDTISCFNCNPRDYKELKKLFISIMKNEKIDQIETPYEFYMENLSKIREDFNIPGLSSKEVNNLRFKDKMKDSFYKHNVPCAKHKLISSYKELEQEITEIRYPCIFKPLNNAGCRQVYKVLDSKDALKKGQEFFESGQPFQYEEYVDIKVEGSYDVIVMNGKIIFGTITEYYPKVIETVPNPGGHRVYLKNDLPNDLDTKIRELGRQAIESLNIKHSFAHIEYFIDHNKRVLINEVGARIPGANIPLLINYSQGFSIEKIWASHLVKNHIDLTYDRTWQTGIIYLTGKDIDVITNITGWDYLRNIYKDNIVEYKLPKLGDSVKKNRININDTEGYVIVKDRSSEKLRHILDTIDRNLKFI